MHISKEIYSKHLKNEYMPTTVTLMYQWVIISSLQSVKKKCHVIINYYNNRKKTISIYN